MNEIILVGIVGSSVICLAMVEGKLEKQGKHVEAELLHMIYSLVLNIGAFGTMAWFVFKVVKEFFLNV